MNEMSLYGDRRMTVREVSDALGVSEQTIRYWIRKEFPGMAENGKATMLTEAQATAIKRLIGTGRNDLENVVAVAGSTTELEMMMLDAKVAEWKSRRIAELQRELAIAAPKVESFDALMRSERTMSITDAAKHFGMHPKTQVFPYLRSMGYLTLTDLPTQAAIDAGYLSLRESASKDGRVWPQAVVEAWQLENWRAHVVHQVKYWCHKRASA